MTVATRKSRHSRVGRLFLILALLATGALLASACGGDDDSATPPPAAPATPEPAPAPPEPAPAPPAETPAPAPEEPPPPPPAEPAAPEPAAEEPTMDDEPLEILFMYSGPARDGGWTQTFDNARQQLEQTYGDRIETTFKESLWGADVIASVIDTAIIDGIDVIIGTSFEQGEPMIAAAAENPDVFFIASQWDNPGGLDNFAGYVNAPEDGAYISGVLSGLMTEPARRHRLGRRLRHPLRHPDDQRVRHRAPGHQSDRHAQGHLHQRLGGHEPAGPGGAKPRGFGASPSSPRACRARPSARWPRPPRFPSRPCRSMPAPTRRP